MADYKINHECRRPNVAVSDHMKDGVPIVNRSCLTCKAHWYGPVESVKEYTGKEWDEWMDEGSKSNTYTTSCPACKAFDAFLVTIKESGSGFNHHFGMTEYWWSGDGKCKECGHEGEYSDGSL